MQKFIFSSKPTYSPYQITNPMCIQQLLLFTAIIIGVPLACWLIPYSIGRLAHAIFGNRYDLTTRTMPTLNGFMILMILFILSLIGILVVIALNTLWLYCKTVC